MPVEGDQGGPGTLFGHWDEATYSDLSVASMGGLGYVVNLGTGDRYRLPSTPGPALTASAVAGQGPGLDLKGRERLLKPVAVVR